MRERTKAACRVPHQLRVELLASKDDVDYINVLVAVRARGPLDLLDVQNAWQHVVRRHDVTRLSLSRCADDVTMEVSPRPAQSIAVVDLAIIRPGGARRKALRYHVRRVLQPPFRLQQQEPLVRALIVRVGRREHLLFWVWAHAIFDAHSWRCFLYELTTLYATRGDTTVLPQLPPAPTLRRALRERRDMAPKTVGYWKQQLAGRTGHLAGVEAADDSEAMYYPAALAFPRVDKTIVARVSRVCERVGGSLSIAALAAVACSLYACTGQRELVVSVLRGNRERSEQHVLGCLVDYLPIPIGISEDLSFQDLVAALQTKWAEAKRHIVPSQHLAKLVEGPCSAMFNFVRLSPGVIEGHICQTRGVTFDAAPLAHLTASFPVRRRWWGAEIDFNVHLTTAGCLNGYTSYNKLAVKRETAVELGARTLHVLKLGGLHPEATIRHLVHRQIRRGDRAVIGI